MCAVDREGRPLYGALCPFASLAWGVAWRIKGGGELKRGSGLFDFADFSDYTVAAD